ncbi:hypothetical protein AAFC00_002854 [Neodothiora populina]|uniref:CRIB domain-containing protein n=1 Tax=Neodothiora populina TaxID=2781224 RepID=A0ABR3P8F7_9PEZI
MKWFAVSNDGADNMRDDTWGQSAQYDESLKKDSNPRISSTFADTRPWNFKSSSQASERSSSSSRKRLSLFGARSSNTSVSPTTDISADEWVILNQDNSSHNFSAYNVSDSGSALAASISKSSFGGERRRSSLFSRKATSRLARAGEGLVRYRSNVRSSMDFGRKDEVSESDDSMWYNQESDTSSEAKASRRYTKQIKKNSISAPFNFQHITHTQKGQIPGLESITDHELFPEFWAASRFRQSQNELSGVDAQRIEREFHAWVGSRGRSNSNKPSDRFNFPRAPPARPSHPAPYFTSATATPSTDAAILGSESRPIIPHDGRGRSRSFNRPGPTSAERLVTSNAEQRELPALVHPAFRGQTMSPLDSRPRSSGQIHESLMSLDSVPEENEAFSGSPRKPNQRPSLFGEGSPASTLSSNTRLTPFPAGNAFARSQGCIGDDSYNAKAFSGESGITTLTGESWENNVDFLYLVEAESTCDFDWTSLKSSKRGSESSQNRRDSGAASSTRESSMADDESSRAPSSRHSGNASHDGLFADFDGVSPSTTPSPVTKFNFSRPISRRHSAISIGNSELTPIPEVSDTTFHDDIPSEQAQIRHTRSASHSDQRPSMLKQSLRWSIASPSDIPEDVKCRRLSFIAEPEMSLPEQTLFSAPPLPPPAAPLPELPVNKATGLISPPISPPQTSNPDFTTVRRPSSSQDRALLQAAGRIVQRGRTARPSTPSRLSHVQNAKDTSPRSLLSAPATPPKMGSTHFHLPAFPTPPQSPPQQQHEDYPAWI